MALSCSADFQYVYILESDLYIPKRCFTMDSKKFLTDQDLFQIERIKVENRKFAYLSLLDVLVGVLLAVSITSFFEYARSGIIFFKVFGIYSAIVSAICIILKLLIIAYLQGWVLIWNFEIEITYERICEILKNIRKSIPELKYKWVQPYIYLYSKSRNLTVSFEIREKSLIIKCTDTDSTPYILKKINKAIKNTFKEKEIRYMSYYSIHFGVQQFSQGWFAEFISFEQVIGEVRQSMEQIDSDIRKTFKRKKSW